MAALAISPSEAYSPQPTPNLPSHSVNPVTAATETPPPRVVQSAPQPAPKPFPTVANVPDWDGMEGIEVTDEKGLYMALVPKNTDLIKVDLPSTTAELQQKTTFVAIRWAGYKAISFCGFVSNWEVQDKYDKQFLPDEADDPCTADEMNKIKNFHNFGRKLNGKNKIDGVSVAVRQAASCDTTFYRNYLPPKDSEVGTPENQDYKPQDPVILGNHTEVQIVNDVFYRYLSSDLKSAAVRLDPSEITGATVDEINSMSLWGRGVDADCLTPAKGGPDKSPDAVRGHNPNSTGQ
jgi:hypothetical protein